MMISRPKIIVDDNIPFIKGRLEPFADISYVGQWEFTPSLVRDADALVIRTRTRCDADLLAGSSVRLIATATIGMDQIDLSWCEANGIKVVNSPGCNAPGVAQYVWSSLLRCGFDSECNILGIVGCGNVGSIVAAWAKLLGIKTLVSDPPRHKALQQQGYTMTDLNNLLRESDAVTLHTPLIYSGDHPTYHLINEGNIGLIKPNALLINAARGPVVDFKALRNKLEDGRIRAIIDTWEDEPKVDQMILQKSEYATFHIAGYSLEGKQRATRIVLESIGKEFGFQPSLDGLATHYYIPSEISSQQIVDSYDPANDTEALRSRPYDFDILRANYIYRREP